MTPRAEEDGYFTAMDAFGLGAVQALSELPAWSDEDIAAYEAALARRRPVGFMPWPEEVGPVGG